MGATTAHFVTNMKGQIEPLFTRVLMICDKEGLIGQNMFAIDGCLSFFNEQPYSPYKLCKLSKILYNSV